MAAGNLDLAVRFLEQWEPDGPWLLTAIKPDSRDIETRRFDDPDTLRTWLERQQGRRNVYFSANRPKPGHKSRCKKEDIAEFLGPHIDLDPRKDPGLDLAAEQAALLDRLKTHHPPPSAIVFSGGGYQGFWRLDEPVAVNGNIAELEAYNIGLEQALGADHCHNIDRIMRVPGTINLPDAKKRALGRTATAAELVYFDANRVYRLDDFQPAGDADNGHSNGSASPPEPETWLSKVIRLGHDPVQPERWGGDRSKAVFAVACGLVKALWSDDQIAAVLVDANNGISAHVRDQKDPQAYALRQAAQARKSVVTTGSDFGARRQTYRWQGRDFVREVDGVCRDDRGAVLRKTEAGYQIEEPEPAPPETPVALDLGQDIGPIPPRQWLLGNTFARGFLSGLIGQGGAAKTTIRLLQLIAAATGRGNLVGETVHQRSRALFVCLEDDEDEIRRRIRAACICHEVPQTELAGWLFLWTTKRDKFLALGAYGAAEPGSLGDALRRLIRRHAIDIVCIDPWVKSHLVNENDNSLIDETVNLFLDLASEENVAPDYTHHTRKGSPSGGDADAGRGASALPWATRLLRSAAKMTSEEAELFGQSEHDRQFLIRLDDAKVNIVPPADKTTWFQLVSIDVGNGTGDYPDGDAVQAVKLWTPPDIFKDLTLEVANKILDQIDAGLPGEPEGRRYSGQAQAKERAAWPVVAQHCPTLAEAQARRIINIWLKNGVLAHDSDYTDPKTRKKGSALAVRKRPGNTWEL